MIGIKVQSFCPHSLNMYSILLQKTMAIKTFIPRRSHCQFFVKLFCVYRKLCNVILSQSRSKIAFINSHLCELKV